MPLRLPTRWPCCARRPTSSSSCWPRWSASRCPPWPTGSSSWSALLQHWFFTSIPDQLGFHGPPVWWPLPLLAVAGVLVSLTITYLPGTAGHEPAEGFKSGGGAPTAAELPGVFLAALATLALGVVLGPEAPLIAIGGGLGVLAVRLAARDAPPTAGTVMAAAGSFAAISTLLGSPIIGAFLLMEASGLGGPVLGLVLVPGLLAAGIGTLIFVGLDNLTGWGTFSLAIPGLPHFAPSDGGPAPLGRRHRRVRPAGRNRHPPARAGPPDGDRRGVGSCSPRRRDWSWPASRWPSPRSPGRAAPRSSSPARAPFPAWSSMPGRGRSGPWSLLVLAKSVAYGVSLSSFRGGPIFPAMFIGVAIGRGRLPPAGHVGGPRGGHGPRGHDHGHAPAAPDRDPARHPALRRRRADPRPPDHRGRGRGLRGHGLAAPDTGRPPRRGSGHRRPPRTARRAAP